MRNLADPAYEPSDDELLELSRLAFADVARERREIDRKLNQEIARLQAEALVRLRALKAP